MLACEEIKRPSRLNAMCKNLLQEKARHKISNHINNLPNPPWFLPLITVPLTTVCTILLFSSRSRSALDIGRGLESALL